MGASIPAAESSMMTLVFDDVPRCFKFTAAADLSTGGMRSGGLSSGCQATAETQMLRVPWNFETAGRTPPGHRVCVDCGW